MSKRGRPWPDEYERRKMYGPRLLPSLVERSMAAARASGISWARWLEQAIEEKLERLPWKKKR